MLLWEPTSWCYEAAISWSYVKLMLGAAQANWRALAWKWHKPGLRLQLCLCLDVWFWEGYLPPWASDFPECSHHVNESGAWLQRSIKRQVKGKDSLFYFRGCNRGWGVGILFHKAKFNGKFSNWICSHELSSLQYGAIYYLSSIQMVWCVSLWFSFLCDFLINQSLCN